MRRRARRQSLLMRPLSPKKSQSPGRRFNVDAKLQCFLRIARLPRVSAAYSNSSLASGNAFHRYAASPVASAPAVSPMARGLVEETVLVELQGQVELPSREGASATASRREESRSACDEVSATPGEDPERNRNRPGGLTSHTIQRPEFAREKKQRPLRSHPRNLSLWIIGFRSQIKPV